LYNIFSANTIRRSEELRGGPFDGRCFVRLDSRVSNVFDASMRTKPAQRLVSIDLNLIKHVLTVWPLTSTLACLMFDGV